MGPQGVQTEKDVKKKGSSSDPLRLNPRYEVAKNYFLSDGMNNLLAGVDLSLKFFSDLEERQLLRGYRYIVPRLGISARIS